MARRSSWPGNTAELGAPPAAELGAPPAAERSVVFGSVQGFQNHFGNSFHGGPPVHGGTLNPLERLGLGHALLGLQQTFGPFDELAGLQPVRQRRYFAFQRGDLAEVAEEVG